MPAVMSLLPAFFGARKRADEDQAPVSEPETSREREPRDDEAFSLVPPRASDDHGDRIDRLDRLDRIDRLDRLAKSDRPERTEAAEKVHKPEKPKKVEGRNVRGLGVTDLSRLSIDNDGRLYWDGKPVEVRRRLMMSRRQTVGASLLAIAIVLGAAGALVQGWATAYDWACKLGWASTYCSSTLTKPPARPDIPA